MKKYNLGSLKVSDKELFDTKEEIVEELIDRMQKYVAQSDDIMKDSRLSTEEKYNEIKCLHNRFGGLADFLNLTLDIEVRQEDGMLYTQAMSNKLHHRKLMLELELGRQE